MKNLGSIEILDPSCDLSTIEDGRGGIFTWLPKEPLLEFNLLFFQSHKIRGNHFHPEFTEYFLVIQGSGVIITVDEDTGQRLSLQASVGTCVRIPQGISHTFYAITEVRAVSFLTKPWGECKTPIVRKEIVSIRDGLEDSVKAK